MFSGTLTPILRCSDCGSQLVELRGPVTKDADVACAKCGAATGRWVDFLSRLEERVGQQQEELSGGRLRYRARKRAEPTGAWHIILSMPLGEAPPHRVLALSGISTARSSLVGSPHLGGHQEQGAPGGPAPGPRHVRRGPQGIDVKREDAA